MAGEYRGSKPCDTHVDDLSSLDLIARVKWNQLRMLEERGYNITEFDKALKKNMRNEDDTQGFWTTILEKIPALKSPDPKVFASQATSIAVWNSLGGIYEKPKDGGAVIRNLVVYLPAPQDKSFPTSALKANITLVKRDPTINFVDFLYEAQIRQVHLNEIYDMKRPAAVWTYAGLTVPITDSYYIGTKFRVLTPEEFNSYYVDAAQLKPNLPQLPRDDPLVLYKQWEPGMVIRTIEQSDYGVLCSKTIKDFAVSPLTIAMLTESTGATAETS